MVTRQVTPECRFHRQVVSVPIKVLFLLAIIVLFVNCRREESRLPTVRLVPSNEDGFVRLSDLFDSIRIIQLETTESSLLSSIYQVGFCDNKILIRDKQAGIRVFDASGKYLNNIGSFGVGPGEYVNPGKMYVDSREKILYLSNAAKKEILKYNLEGKFLGSISIPEHFGHIYITDDQEIILVSVIPLIFYKNYFDLLKLSPLGDTIMLLRNNDLVPIKNTIELSVVPTFSFEINDKIYLKRAFNDTLFSIYGSTIDPVALLDNGGKGLGFRDMYVKKASDFNKYLIVIDLLIVRDKLLIHFNYQGNQYWSIYNFSDGQLATRKVGASELGNLPLVDVSYYIENDIIPELGNMEIGISNGIYYSILENPDLVLRNRGEIRDGRVFSDGQNPAILIYK